MAMSLPRCTALLAGAVWMLRRGHAWDDVVEVLGQDVVEAFDLAAPGFDGRAPQEPASGHSGDGWANLNRASGEPESPTSTPPRRQSSEEQQ